jgi:hypothetical protein
LSLLVLATACGGADSTSPADRRGLKVIDGGGATDTVVTILGQALIMEVRDSTGALPPPGTVMRFTTSNASISPLDANSFTSFAARDVDGTGRAAVIVRLGTVAGVGRVVVNVPAMGFVDTVIYTILPGSAARVTVAPADTLISVGRTFKFRGGVVDQFGNARADPVGWTVDQGATVTTDGVFTPSTVARYHVTAAVTVAGATRTATPTVSVVPNVRVAAWRNGRMVIMDLDGGNSRDLAAVVDGGIGASAQWMPDRGGVIYSTDVADHQVLIVADTNGTARPFFSSPPPNVLHQAEPRVTANGQWLVFAAYDTRCNSYCLYRARLDGTGAELLSSAVTGSNPILAPSPDGSRVAFSVGGGVRMFDVGTRTLSTWTQTVASSPAWSPDGSKIAVVNGGSLALMDPSGTITRTLPTSPRSSEPRMAWLSDSRFLLARSVSGAFDLIDTQSGAEIPLPFTNSIGAMSVR